MKNLHLIFVFCFSFLILNSQDKLFFNNGSVKKGIVVSIGKDLVFFKNSDTSLVQRIKKSDLLLVEDYKGTRYIFAQTQKEDGAIENQLQTKSDKKNSFGLQPLGIFLGRATFNYERLTKDNKIGFVFPLSLTFDPLGTFYKSGLDSNSNTKRIKGINFISGLDVNFYVGKYENHKFFIGPRIRYGTDVFLRNIEAYTLQTQFGWRIGSPDQRVVQHVSFGFGFVRILSSPGARLINPKQSYGWFSVNYRIGIKW